jgi:phosphoribosylformylglycinamidine synthase
VGGNVSFYNETSGQAILPTPIIGVVGIVDEAERLVTQSFSAEGDRIALLGPDAVSLGGSEYLWMRDRIVAGALAPLDLGLERRVQAAVREAVNGGLVSAAHDCADGGLAVALAEACVSGRHGRVGCEAQVRGAARLDLELFGEGPSRIVVAVAPERARSFEARMAESAIPWRWIGTTGGDRLRIRAGARMVVDVDLNRIERAWRGGFERHVA